MAMVNTPHISFNANDRSYLSILKKEIHRLVTINGFEQKKIDEIDLLVAEMGSNLVKHAIEGEILAGVVEQEGNIALELISIDNGPGIAEPEKMMQDGFSTTSTMGHGLGSIRRFSDAFEIYSKKDWGTIVLSRVYSKTDPVRPPSHPSLQLRALVVAKPGELVSGDGCFSIRSAEGVIKLLAADGLGHGAEANRAVNEAILAFKTIDSGSPAEILRFIHNTIKKTRGIVATAVLIDTVKKTWKICGVGNIATRLNGFQQSRNYISYNGIIGHNIPNTLNDQELSQNDFQQIILCSDGIKSRWEQAKFPAMHKYDLIVQAAALYKDYGRKTDDMSIVMGRAFP
jgi:anti-sigma regulatory factor (Ser/Thr protein kinase)